MKPKKTNKKRKKTNKKLKKRINNNTRKKITKHTIDYIFGYGSLISSESRKYTGKGYIGKAIPVILSKKAGFIRKWVCKKSTNGKMSFLGLEKTTKSTNIYGVLCPIFKCIENFDKREKGYKRIKINSKESRKLFKPFIKNKLPREPFNVYIYTVETSVPPNKKCPISQQYLDVVINGCLEYSKKFAKHFLKNTINWRDSNGEVYWINNRNKEYKKKYKIKKLNFKNIDKILKETIPQYYKGRI